MTARRPRSRTRNFKPPFLIGVLGSSALIGCYNQSEGEREDDAAILSTETPCPAQVPATDSAPSPPASMFGTATLQSNPPAPLPVPQCPTQKPLDGAGCSPGQTPARCHYEDSCEPTWMCSADGRWQNISQIGCNPPELLPPVPTITSCPSAPPAVNSSCTQYASELQCIYCPIAVRCDAGIWIDTLNACPPTEVGPVDAGVDTADAGLDAAVVDVDASLRTDAASPRNAADAGDAAIQR
jgi:hypothetical protein